MLVICTKSYGLYQPFNCSYMYMYLHLRMSITCTGPGDYRVSTTSVEWRCSLFAKGSHLHVHTYILLVETFYKRDQVWSVKIVLDCLIVLTKALNSLIFRRSKDEMVATPSWYLNMMVDFSDFCCSDFILIPWSSLKNYLDRLIPFWSRPQTSLQVWCAKCREIMCSFKLLCLLTNWASY